MNANRRKQIQVITDEIVNLMSQVETLRDEEQDAFDAMPEGIQNSERGEKSQNAIDQLDNAASSITETIDGLNEARE